MLIWFENRLERFWKYTSRSYKILRSFNYRRRCLKKKKTLKSFVFWSTQQNAATIIRIPYAQLKFLQQIMLTLCIMSLFFFHTMPSKTYIILVIFKYIWVYLRLKTAHIYSYTSFLIYNDEKKLKNFTFWWAKHS